MAQPFTQSSRGMAGLHAHGIDWEHRRQLWRRARLGPSFPGASPLSTALWWQARDATPLSDVIADLAEYTSDEAVIIAEWTGTTDIDDGDVAARRTGVAPPRSMHEQHLRKIMERCSRELLAISRRWGLLPLLPPDAANRFLVEALAATEDLGHLWFMWRTAAGAGVDRHASAAPVLEAVCAPGDVPLSLPWCQARRLVLATGWRVVRQPLLGLPAHKGHRESAWGALHAIVTDLLPSPEPRRIDAPLCDALLLLPGLGLCTAALDPAGEPGLSVMPITHSCGVHARPWLRVPVSPPGAARSASQHCLAGAAWQSMLKPADCCRLESVRVLACDIAAPEGNLTAASITHQTLRLQWELTDVSRVAPPSDAASAPGIQPSFSPLVAERVTLESPLTLGLRDGEMLVSACVVPLRGDEARVMCCGGAVAAAAQLRPADSHLVPHLRPAAVALSLLRRPPSDGSLHGAALRSVLAVAQAPRRGSAASAVDTTAGAIATGSTACIPDVLVTAAAEVPRATEPQLASTTEALPRPAGAADARIVLAGLRLPSGSGSVPTSHSVMCMVTVHNNGSISLSKLLPLPVSLAAGDETPTVPTCMQALPTAALVGFSCGSVVVSALQTFSETAIGGAASAPLDACAILALPSHYRAVDAGAGAADCSHAVTCIECGPSLCAVGYADGVVSLWCIKSWRLLHVLCPRVSALPEVHSPALRELTPAADAAASDNRCSKLAWECTARAARVRALRQRSEAAGEVHRTQSHATKCSTPGLTHDAASDAGSGCSWLQLRRLARSSSPRDAPTAVAAHSMAVLHLSVHEDAHSAWLSPRRGSRDAAEATSVVSWLRPDGSGASLQCSVRAVLQPATPATATESGGESALPPSPPLSVPGEHVAHCDWVNAPACGCLPDASLAFTC